MDIGDIIFYAVIIISLLFGAMKKIKKEINTGDLFSTPDNEEVESNIPIFTPKKAVVTKIEKQMPKKTKQSDLGNYMEKYIESISTAEEVEESRLAYFDESQDNSYALIKTQQSDLLSHLRDGDIREEMKRGIIYQEILNRKYT